MKPYFHQVKYPIHFLIMMKAMILPILFLISAQMNGMSTPTAGFFLPDTVFEFTMKYRAVRNLVILPVTINDSIRVNLILDTGCRNLLLFGKRFQNLFQTGTTSVQFSGLGSGKPVKGKLSLNNNVAIALVRGTQIPVIIVPDKNLFSALPKVDGVIGYEIFTKFEIELNHPSKEITFRSAADARPSSGYTYVPMELIDSKPVIKASFLSKAGEVIEKDLVIDTGSSLGLLFSGDDDEIIEMVKIGKGLNGDLRGMKYTTPVLRLRSVEFDNVSISVSASGNDYASLGMDTLKDHAVILNYSRSYAAFRKTRPMKV